MNNQSIHPRVVSGRTVGKKSNTSKPCRVVGGYNRKMTAKFDARQRDYQATIGRAKGNGASAYTMPGSRRLDKN